jgi:hypothetical protein
MLNHAAEPPRLSGNKLKVTGFGEQYRLFPANFPTEAQAENGFILHRNRSFHHHIHQKRWECRGTALEKTVQILYISCPFWLNGRLHVAISDTSKPTAKTNS